MPGVASTEISFVRDIAAAGFIAGTVPTKSMSGHRARNCGNAKVEAVLQAITTMSGSCSPICAAMTARMRAANSGSPQEP